MKKGCAFKALIYFILITAVVVYLVEKYGKIVYEDSKEKIQRTFIEQIEAQVNNFSREGLGDSLSGSFMKKVDELKSNREADTEKFERIIGGFKLFLDTNTVDRQITSKLKEIIADYEQREKK
jgi:hypothetical protein